MKSLLSICVAVGMAAVIGAEEPAKDKASLDPAKLVGEWSYVSGVRAGEKVPAENLAGKVTITKDTITVPAGPDMKFLMAYKVNTKVSPATIDIDIKDGPVKEGKAEGIIALEDGQLKLCYAVVGEAKRPTTFESTAENKAFSFVLKPAK